MKTILVIGANSGLGLWTSKHLLDLDYKFIMACRSMEKAQKATANFREFDTKKNYEKGKPVASSVDSYDSEKAILLWQGSEALIGSKFLNT